MIATIIKKFLTNIRLNLMKVVKIPLKRAHYVLIGIDSDVRMLIRCMALEQGYFLAISAKPKLKPTFGQNSSTFSQKFKVMRVSI